MCRSNHAEQITENNNKKNAFIILVLSCATTTESIYLLCLFTMLYGLIVSDTVYNPDQTFLLQPELECMKHNTPDWKPAWGKG